MLKEDRLAKIWEKEILSNENTNETAYSISKNQQGDYYICIGKNSSKKQEVYSPEIIKMDGFGNIIWQRSFQSESKDYHQFKANVAKNGDIILTGSSVSNLSIGYRSDAFIKRINSYGNILWTSTTGTFNEDDWGLGCI